MLLSATTTTIKNAKPVSKGSLKQKGYASYVASWAQQVLTKKTSRKPQLRLDEDTLKFEETQVTFTLLNERGVKHPGSLQFFEGGILNLVINNPNNKSGFSIYDVEPRPKLTSLYPHTTKNDNTQCVINFSETADYENSPKKSKYSVIINMNPFKLFLLNDSGKELLQINADEKFTFEEHLLFDIRFPSHHLWGLAERADNPYLEDTNTIGPLKEPYRLWARDHPNYKPYSPIGLYGAIPVVLNLQDEETRNMVGVYQANGSETYVEVDKTEGGHSDMTWLNQAGDFEVYITAADNFRDYFNQYAKITGFSYLPPIWALGFHQCRYSYMTEEEVDEVNEKLKEYDMPCDSITLDIDYTDGYKYFTWNPKTFPDPAAMIQRLRASKRRLVTINDPHLKADESYDLYKKAKEEGLLVRNEKGKIYEDYCWPGKSSWLDFLNPAAQDLWASMYDYKNYPHTTRDVHAWNDMNEPAVFNPETEASMHPKNKHRFFKNGEPRDVDHKYAHNLYGLLHTKGTFKGMVARDYPKKYRPFILSRSFFAGTQKYSMVWSGDSGSGFKDLASQVPLALNTSLCGISFNGGDVGGFMGDPTPECATRWFQIAMFMPFYRAHSAIDTPRREPYLYEPLYRNIIAKTIQERYRWLYYLYNTFEEYVRTGYPVMRTVWMETTQNIITPSLIKEGSQFFFGGNLLVVPIAEKHVRTVQIHEDLQNDEWFSYDKGYVEKNSEPIKTGLESIGYFIRAGSIIPLADLPAEFNSTEDVVTRPLHLFITIGQTETARGTFYIDDTESFDYQDKCYVRREFEFRDMKLTNKNIDEGQNSDNIRDNFISTITLCGTTEEITNWCVTNVKDHDLEDHKIDLKDKSRNMIHIRRLKLPVKSDWEIVFKKQVTC